MKRVLLVIFPLVALTALAAGYAVLIRPDAPAAAPARQTAVPPTATPVPGALREIEIYDLGLG